MFKSNFVPFRGGRQQAVGGREILLLPTAYRLLPDLFFPSVTILILLAASAGTWIISAHFWSYANGFMLLHRRIVILIFGIHHFRLASTGTYQLFFAHFHFTHVCLLLTAFPQRSIFLDGNSCLAKE